MTDLMALKAANAKRWENAKMVRNFNSVARALIVPTAKARYQAVEKITGVPWAFIAVVHEREMIRAVVVAIALLVSHPAQAVSCWVVRRAVAQYGVAAVEAWARAKGISEKEIEKARRCLR